MPEKITGFKNQSSEPALSLQTIAITCNMHINAHLIHNWLPISLQIKMFPHSSLSLHT